MSAQKISTIVLPNQADEKLRLAAEDAASLLDEITGVRPNVLISNMRYPKNALFLGDSLVTAPKFHLPADLPPSASVATWRRGNRILIRAQKPSAVSDGLYTFLQEEYGVRYLHSRIEPVFKNHAKTVKPSRRRVIYAPAFEARQYWNHSEVDYSTAHSRRSRLNIVYEINHSMADIFTAELFESRPELFSTRNGRQSPPSGSNSIDPQPNLASRKAAQYAAEYVLRYFKENPEATSFPLGINDNVLFDDTKLTRQHVEPLKWFRGRPNYSDLVFTFTNRVAKIVFDENGAWNNSRGEPRYLTALAYYWAEAVPSFELHPRIIPILTADRAQWHDPLFKAEDKDLIAAWSRCGAEKIGTWDYYMGPPLPYPRQHNTIIAESIRHLAEQGVSVFFPQLLGQSLAFDGAKGYLVARLLWDPWLDVEILIDEFYAGVFGSAAPLMREFHEAFEKERSLREGAAAWIKFYYDEACIELFSETFLTEMASILDDALLLVAEEPEARERVLEVKSEFALSLDYRSFQKARRMLYLEMAALEADAATGSSGIIEAIVAYSNASTKLEETLDSLVNVSARFRNYNWLYPNSQLQSKPLYAAIGALAFRPLKESERASILSRIPAYAPLFVDLLNARKSGGNVISRNPELVHIGERNDGRYLLPQPMPQIPGWSINARPSRDFRITYKEDWSKRGICFSGAEVASCFTQLPIKAESFYLLRVNLGYVASPDNRSIVEVIWLDQNGDRLGKDRLFQAPTTWCENDEKTLPKELSLNIPLRSPQDATDLIIRFATSRQAPTDFYEINYSELREFSTYGQTQ